MDQADAGAILRDDGDYYIERNTNYPPGKGNGFLLRRCATSVATPGGYECVGGYDHQVSTGKWHADINAPLDEENDSDVTSVGAYNTPDEAIDALWRHRHGALCRHPRY